MLISLVDRLEERLKHELPGEQAQRLMAPRPVDEARFNFKERHDARLSSVLILLFPSVKAINFPLILRPTYSGAHSGQVALPGGKLEEGDKDRYATALRETHEEIGIDPSKIKLIGHLTELYVAASNFKVLPVVGYVDFKPNFIPQPEEVSLIFDTPIDALLDKRIRKEKELMVGNNYKIRSPYFDIHGQVVWGATAMMLSEFTTILEEIR